MTANPEPPVPVPFAGMVANITRAGEAEIRPAPSGPPERIDGYTIGAIPNLDRPAPHRGEMHPDGDELLYVISGAIAVIFDDGDEQTIGATTSVVVRGGEVLRVPRGVWHRVDIVEPAFLVHVTPGPNGPHRPQQ